MAKLTSAREGLGANPAERAALLYLALPTLIFIAGWLRWPVAALLLVACACLLYSGWTCFGKCSAERRSTGALIWIAGTALAWSAFGGGSHFMYANTDWVVRDAVLGDLVRMEWPLHYRGADGTDLILRSAIGFFLPPALFGKFAGFQQLDLVMYAWTTLGVALFLLLLPLPAKPGLKLVAGLVLVVFFSGMDFLGQLIATESLPDFPLRLAWWVPLSYPALTIQILWAPNHCLPIWISTLLILRHLDTHDFPLVVCVILPLTLIWTPFAVLGLLPFLIRGAYLYGKTHWRQAVLPWHAIASGAALTAVMLAFLLLDIGGIDSRLPLVPDSAMAPANHLFQAVSLHSYLLFVSCEFMLLAMVLWPNVSRGDTGNFYLAVAILLVLPLFKFGPNNDFILRTSGPSLIVLLSVSLRTLVIAAHSPSVSSRVLAWLFLAIGANTAFYEFWRAAAWPRWKPDYQQTLAQRQGGQPAHHYVGALGNSPLRNILKPPSNKVSED